MNEYLIIKEREILCSFYHSANGDNWKNNTNWLSDTDIKEWHGVSTNKEGRVTGISLIDNGIKGNIPDEIYELNNLESLLLSLNNLFDKISPKIGNLEKIRRLDLGDNSLSGVIPEEIYLLTELTFLRLSQNQLSGEISKKIEHLTKLKYLGISRNQFTGSIPVAFCNFPNLIRLHIFDNNFTQPYPQEILDWAKKASHHVI